MLKSDVWNANWSDAWNLHGIDKMNGSTLDYTFVIGMGAIATAMVGSIFSSDAWNSVTFIAGEMKNRKEILG